MKVGVKEVELPQNMALTLSTIHLEQKMHVLWPEHNNTFKSNNASYLCDMTRLMCHTNTRDTNLTSFNPMAKNKQGRVEGDKWCVCEHILKLNYNRRSCNVISEISETKHRM